MDLLRYLGQKKLTQFFSQRNILKNKILMLYRVTNSR